MHRHIKNFTQLFSDMEQQEV